MGQHLPAHGVDGRGGQAEPGLHHALDRLAAVGGAPGLGQALVQLLPGQGPVLRRLGQRAFGLADVAQLVLDRQHGVLAPGDDGVEVHAHQRRLAVLIARPGLLQQGPVLPLPLPDAEHVRPGLSDIVALGEALAGEDVPQVLHVGGGNDLSVDGGAVEPGGHGHVFRPLHPALDLHRGHAQTLQLAHPGDEAVVLEAQGILLLVAAVAVAEPAGLGALAPVAGAGAHHGGEIALAGIAHAQGPVDEDLNLDGAVAADEGDVLPAELPGKHHSAHAHGGGLLHALERVDAHLGGGVDRHLGGHLPQEGHDAQVLDDEGVHPGADGGGDGPAHLLQLPVGNQGVEGQVDADAPDMAVAHGVRQLVKGKVLGALPGVEGAGAQIDRVGPVLYRGAQGVHGAGGG